MSGKALPNKHSLMKQVRDREAEVVRLKRHLAEKEAEEQKSEERVGIIMEVVLLFDKDPQAVRDFLKGHRP